MLISLAVAFLFSLSAATAKVTQKESLAAFNRSLLTASVTGKDRVYISKFIGGPGDDQTHEYWIGCPSGTVVTQILTANGAFMDRIQFQCSDGSKSPAVGGPVPLTNTTLDKVERITNVTVFAGAVVDAIAYAGRKVGGNTGVPINVALPSTLAGSCALVGAGVRSNRIINAISWVFGCNGKSIFPLMDAKLLGEPEGKLRIFQCPGKSFISRMSATRNFTSFVAHCSDNTLSGRVTSGMKQGPLMANGIVALTLHRDTTITGLSYDDAMLGVLGSVKELVPNPVTSPADSLTGCPMTGIMWRQSNKGVHAMGFHHDCSVFAPSKTQAPTETVVIVVTPTA